VAQHSLQSAPNIRRKREAALTIALAAHADRARAQSISSEPEGPPGGGGGREKKKPLARRASRSRRRQNCQIAVATTDCIGRPQEGRELIGFEPLGQFRPVAGARPSATAETSERSVTPCTLQKAENGPQRRDVKLPPPRHFRRGDRIPLRKRVTFASVSTRGPKTIGLTAWGPGNGALAIRSTERSSPGTSPRSVFVQKQSVSVQDSVTGPSTTGASATGNQPQPAANVENGAKRLACLNFAHASGLRRSAMNDQPAPWTNHPSRSGLGPAAADQGHKAGLRWLQIRARPVSLRTLNPPRVPLERAVDRVSCPPLLLIDQHDIVLVSVLEREGTYSPHGSAHYADTFKRVRTKKTMA